MLSGKVLTATQLGKSRVSVSIFDAPSIQSYVRSARFDVSPVLSINRVHLGEFVHVGQEDVDFDDLFDASASGFQNLRQVLDALVL